MNCLIELLNSKIIDVDKMDYLIRDSYMTGYDTVSIDYRRLLGSICIKGQGDTCRICYDKSALSVIENVVYAHDAERKWIQSHPTVLYEAYVIENMMRDVMHKILECNQLTWKTEAEFQAIFEANDDELDIIEKEFGDLETHLRTLGLPFVLNRKALEAIKDDMEQSTIVGDLDEVERMLETKKYHLDWVRMFEKFSKNQKIDFEFLFIPADQFNSGFRKPEFSNIEVVFPELKSPCKLNAVSNVLKAGESKRKKVKQEVKITDLITEMISLANQKRNQNKTDEIRTQLN